MTAIWKRTRNDLFAETTFVDELPAAEEAEMAEHIETEAKVWADTEERQVRWNAVLRINRKSPGNVALVKREPGAEDRIVGGLVDDSFYVAPEMRGRGLAREVAKAALDHRSTMPATVTPSAYAALTTAHGRIVREAMSAGCAVPEDAQMDAEDAEDANRPMRAPTENFGEYEIPDIDANLAELEGAAEINPLFHQNDVIPTI